MTRADRLGSIALVTLAAVLVFSQFWISAEQDSLLDATWAQQLHTAFVEQADVGSEFVFTYGPWGFLRQGYDPRTFATAYTVRLVLAALFAGSYFSLARRRVPPLVAGALTLVIASFASIGGGEAVLTAFAPLLVFSEQLSRRKVSVAIAAALGLIALVKFTFFLFAIIVVGSVTLDSLRERRWTWIPVAFSTSLLAAWLGAHQSLSSFLPYIKNSLEIIRGFGPAMSLEPRSVALFALFCVAVVLSLIATSASVRGVAPVLGLAAFLFLQFKAGTVRADTEHMTVAATNLTVLLSICVPFAAERRRIALLVAAVLCLTCLGSTLAGSYEVTVRRVVKNIVYAVQPTFKERLESERAEVFERARSEQPLPPLDGTVDVYPHLGIAAIAANLQYRPRPVIQSYSAYTPKLSALNLEFLQRADSPEYIAFHRFSVDQHYPTIDDTFSRPYLLTAYEPYLLGEMAILKRRSTRWRYSLAPLGTVTGKLGQPVSFGGLVRPGVMLWATVDAPASVAGKIRRVLLRDAPLFIRTNVAPDYIARIVVPAAAGGFLISPLLFEPKAVFVAAAGDIAGLPSVSVVQVDPGDGQISFWTGDVKIRLWEIVVQR